MQRRTIMALLDRCKGAFGLYSNMERLAGNIISIYYSPAIPILQIAVTGTVIVAKPSPTC